MSSFPGPQVQADQSTSSRPVRGPFTVREMRFPWLYAGIIVAGTLDIILTAIILALGGKEANPLANAVLQTHGFEGMILFKYLVVGLVILACEFIADRNRRKALSLAVILVVIHSFPVVWSTSLLLFAV
ncbi:MAG: DUF5658 family protein [Planctomycetota bacterium]